MANYVSKINGYVLKDAEANEAISTLTLEKASHADVAREVETINASIATVAGDLEELEILFNAGGGGGVAPNAVNISFANLASGLEGTNVQTALDETVERLKELEGNGGASVSIRYNDETDNVEVLHDGVWALWKFAGMDEAFLYNHDESEKSMLTWSNGLYPLSATYNSPSSGTLTGATISSYGVESVDFSMYSKMIVTFELNCLSGYGCNGNLKIAIGETQNTSNLMSQVIGNVTNSTTNLSNSVEIDLANINNTEGYIKVELYSGLSANNTTNTTTAYIKSIELIR